MSPSRHTGEMNESYRAAKMQYDASPEGLSVAGKVLPPKTFTRLLGAPRGGRQDNFHRVLVADGTEYCGDFGCHGECGMSKLVRLRPQAVEEGGLGLPDFQVEQASALLGIESVWSNHRWRQSQPWQGTVVLAEYDGEYLKWY